MRIEKELLHFNPQFRPEQLSLTALQSQYLDVMMRSSSIETTIGFFLQQGWLVSFRELYALIEMLISKGFLLNANLNRYFQELKPQSEANFLKQFLPFSMNPAPRRDLAFFKDLPFFRSLDPNLADFLLKNARIVNVPKRSYICKKGNTDRDLYVLLKGQAGIYRTTAQSQHQLMATLNDGSVFGEAGFFLAQPRSADIVSFEDCELLVIPCLPEIFERHIDKSKAEGLQLRFWVQHALQNSEIFKNFPSDCIDALGFSGRIVRTLPNQLLFREGDPGNTAYIVVQGSLVVSQKGKSINVMNQGAFFGEISLLVNQGLRSASIQSQQESLLIEIQQGEFYKLLSQNIFLAKELETLAHARLLRDQTR